MISESLGKRRQNQTLLSEQLKLEQMLYSDSSSDSIFSPEHRAEKKFSISCRKRNKAKSKVKVSFSFHNFI